MEIPTSKEVLTDEDRIAYKLLRDAGLIENENDDTCPQCGYENNAYSCINCGAKFKCLD